MLNMIKMDLYRMVKSRSFFVILLIMLLVTALTTWEAKLAEESLSEAGSFSQEQQVMEEEQEDPVNLGMSVMIPGELGERITIFDFYYANSQAKALALFLVIFTIIFTTADSNSGYIKNIGGQMKSRGVLIISKACSVLVYTVIFLGVYLLFQVLCSRIFLGYLEWGDGKAFLTYVGISVLLSFALEMLCMAIAVLLRNNVFSIIIGICLCMNVMVILYNAIDRPIAAAGIKGFELLRYTITGKLALFPMQPTGRECAGAILLSLIYAVAAILFSSILFEKRDI